MGRGCWKGGLVRGRYIPEKGDFVYLTFDPQSEHEQQGRRPALVISNRLFNQHVGLAVVCPITNTEQRNPFHVGMPTNSNLTGFIMVEQVKSVEYTSRNVEFVELAPRRILETVLDILDVIIYQSMKTPDDDPGFSLILTNFRLIQPNWHGLQTL